MTRRLNYPTAKEVLGRQYPDQDKRVVVIIPNYNEDPATVKYTIERVAETNFHAGLIGLDFEVNEIIMSDQSDENIAKVNRGKLYTAKDGVRSTYSDLNRPEPVPDIYHLTFDDDTEEIVNGYLGDIEEYGPHMERSRPRGKGWNMFLTSLATGMSSDDDVVMIYLDAENEQITTTYPMALGIGLAHEGSRSKFSKSGFTRFHMEGDRRHLGGRVNASVGIPLVDMLERKGTMPKLYYPLSGEIGIVRSAWWNIKIPARYGVEIGTDLQLLSNLTDAEGFPLSSDEFYQVDVGLNMDQPLAEGKDKGTVLEKACEMTGQIIIAALGLAGERIKELWDTHKKFMDDFCYMQEKSIRRWSKGNGVPITGGLDKDELMESTRGVVSGEVEKFYSGKITEDELNEDNLMPVSELRDRLTEIDFEHFVSSLTSKKVEIK